MRLLAFQGLRYTTKAGDAGSLAAPPYDQIDDAARDRFHAASPYHFVNLTRPGNHSDPYRHAAELHSTWLREGIIARDSPPALYPYVVAPAGGSRNEEQPEDGEHPGRLGRLGRLGLMALVGYEPPAVIRPHEQTLDKPLADRTALLEAMRVDLEPALLLADDDGQLETLLAADLRAAGAPLVDYRDADGHQHLLYRVADPERIAQYQRAVASRPAAIADGHHRYKVGQRFAAAHHAAPGTAAAAKLAVVTSMRSRELTIDPIHRALRQPIEPARLGRLASLASTAKPFHGAGGAELARAVAAAPQPALGVWVAGRVPEVWHLAAPATAAATSGAPGSPPPAPPLARLVVQIFQEAVLPALGFGPEAATDGTLIYRSNPDELYARVATGDLGTGFWLPPMQPAEFGAAIANGELLPPKSTRFLPKAMSGLVWSDHQSKVI